MTKDDALKLALEFIERVNKDGWILADFEPQMYATIAAIKEALAQPEQEPMAWEQFYPDIGKPQIEQPKVRTGDCLLVGVCASEGHKIQAKQEQEPVAWQWLDTAHFRKKLPKDAGDGVWNPLYAAPQRTFVGLTDEEIKDYLLKPVERDLLSFTRFIEAKLKQKNGYAEEKNT